MKPLTDLEAATLGLLIEHGDTAYCRIVGELIRRRKAEREGEPYPPVYGRTRKKEIFAGSQYLSRLARKGLVYPTYEPGVYGITRDGKARFHSWLEATSHANGGTDTGQGTE